jgi:transcriptional regulator with XRE-family HTH domain
VSFDVTAAPSERPITGPILRAVREQLGIERSAIARAMGVGRQRIVNIEALASPSAGAARRYLDALEQVAAGTLDPPSG